MQVLAPLAIQPLLGKLSQPSVVKLLTWPHLCDLRDKVVAQDRDGVALWASLLAAGDYITTGERDEILAMLAQTEEVPDPESKAMPTPMRSPDGTPGAWRVENRNEKFVVLWDERLSELGEFATASDAAAAQQMWFDQHPPVPA